MVIQKAVNHLKERPKDERKAVAASLAIIVMIILFFSWAFLFVKKIQKSNGGADLSGGTQDEFNFDSIEETQKQIMGGPDTTSRDQPGTSGTVE